MKKRFTILMTAFLFMFSYAGLAQSQVVSGTTYSTPSVSNLPDDWSGEDGGGTTYIKLIDATHYIQTAGFEQNGFTSITLKARKFGGPSAAQAKISVSWYDSQEEETVLGTIDPASTTLTNYTISNPASTNSGTGYIKIQNKEASSSKGAGVSEVTITYVASGGPQPTYYTVTFDAGEGTFIASNDFPNVSNSVTAGTYILPSATREGYTFDGWNIPTSSELFNGNYTVSGDVDFNAHYTENTTPGPGGDEQWVLTNLADLTENDVFVIVGNNGDNYAMANDNGTGSAPSAVAVTVANDAITGTVAANIQWTISGNANDGYTFYPNGSTETWLYCTNTNNGVRVGTNEANIFEMQATTGYLVHQGTSRYIGVFNSADWRCYSSINNNIANQTFSFYKKVTGGVLPPSIAAENVSIEYNAVSGEIAYTINNGVDGGTLTATTQSDWLTLPNTFDSPIQFTCLANQAATERTAIVTLTYAYGDSQTATKEVTVTQTGNPNVMDNISDITEVGANYHVKGMVVATSTKGFVICDGTGLVYTYMNAVPTWQLGDFVEITGTTGSYGHVIQFTSSATFAEGEEFVFDWPDYTVITEVPDYTEGYHLSDYFQFEGTLTKSGSNYLVAVGESQIRISYPTTEQAADLDDLLEKTVRIHGFFTGYSGSGTNLVFTAMMESYEEVSNPSITLSEYEFNYDAEEHDGYITVTYNLVDSETANVMLCDDEGEELTYEWIEAELDSDRDVHFFMGTNGSTARTAYLKVYGYGPEQQEVSSELVTINQAAYVAPEASITFDPDEVDLEAGEILAYEIPFTYENFEVGGYQDFHIQFYDDNNEPTTKPEWIFLASVTGMDTEGFNVTMAMISANDGAARSAYLKVYAYDEMQNTVYSNLLTINQAACDFAVLPFVWEGGLPTDFDTITGTTLYSVGSYPNQTTYQMKLDSDGDYILVKTDSQPAKVTMGVKMVGGATTSTIFVQGSSDGENFNLIDSLTISGAQNSVLTLETSSPFGEDDRYVKMVFKKGSNVGVGPITITKFTTDPIIEAEDVELAYDATYGEIPYTITNPVVGAGLEVTTNVSWISDISVAEELVTFATTVNQGDEDRVATVTLSYPGAEDKTVTVTQAHFVVDYATLPFEYDGNGTGELPTGLTATDLGTYGSSPKMKFDDSGDNLVLKLDQAPVSLSYTLKGNGTSNLNGVFKVQTSANGVDYVDLAEYATYTLNNKTLTYTLVDLDTEVRYIKWVYTNKDNGNVGLGNIHASIVYDIYGDLSTAALDITPDRTCTIYSGATLDITQMLNNYGTADDLIIMDGAQLKTPNEVRGTIQKIIVGVGQDNWDTNLGYYLLKSPVPGTFNVDRAIEAGMLNGTPESPDFDGIDLYEFSQQNPGEEWQNQKINESFATFGITANHGYLYANINNDTLNFATYSDGESEHLFPATSTEAEVLAIRYSTTTSPFVGWELIGNPFTCNAYLSSERDFYRVNTTGDAIVLATEAVIKPCEGIFVVIEEDDPEEWLTTGESTMAKVHFATTQPQHGPSDHNSLVNINVISNNQVADVARVRFNNGGTLGKMILSESATRLSLAQEGKECSVVRSEAQGELPMNFKAAANGNYTINVDVKDTEMGYLHLIDNLTGNDVDLLATPSYSFEAKTTDYASRFRLVFSANNVDENAIEDAFAFISNGEIILNGVTGNTTIQVFDVTGRMINSTNGANRIATDNMAAGVYMLRLINGDNVKTQKIVVK